MTDTQTKTYYLLAHGRYIYGITQNRGEAIEAGWGIAAKTLGTPNIKKSEDRTCIRWADRKKFTNALHVYKFTNEADLMKSVRDRMECYKDFVKGRLAETLDKEKKGMRL